MNYEEALDYVHSLAPRGWRLGLDRMAEFARLAGLEGELGELTPGARALGPLLTGSSGASLSGEDLHGRDAHATRRFFHVAGTNGKGSTTTYLQAILLDHGERTGGFFSPFVYDPRERMQFGGEMISKEDFAQITTDLRAVAESMESGEFGGPTEFELKTAIGFKYWAEKNATAVALEVGLGGRLDATNIVHPAACCITTIGWDHMAILGDTLEKIAFEKAGIIKPGIPVVLGDIPDGARDVILARALELGAPQSVYGVDFGFDQGRFWSNLGWEIEGLVPGIRGANQGKNVAVAIQTLLVGGVELDAEKVRQAVASAYCPGRMEVLELNGATFILDGAHNKESAENLAESLANLDLPHEGREVARLEVGEQENTSLPRGRRGSVSEANSGEEGSCEHSKLPGAQVTDLHSTGLTEAGLTEQPSGADAPPPHPSSLRSQTLSPSGEGISRDALVGEVGERSEPEVAEQSTKFTLITNMLEGHDPVEFYSILKPFIAEARVVPIDFHRARRVEDTVSALQKLGIPATGSDLSDVSGNPILVTGSFYLVGDVGRLLFSLGATRRLVL